MTSYLYHYHAITQKTVGCIEHWDGTIKTENPVTSQERYQELKKALASQYGEVASNLTIESLSLIWQEQTTK